MCWGAWRGLVSTSVVGAVLVDMKGADSSRSSSSLTVTEVSDGLGQVAM
jgi:hypothetical protein